MQSHGIEVVGVQLQRWEMCKDAPDFDWFLKKLMENQPRIRVVDRLVREAAEVIWSNIHSSLDVDSIVREVPTTRRTLERHFRDQFGRSIREVIAFARLELSKWLLRETSLPIHAIAERVGYSSSDWMGKEIRRSTGATPSEYRRRNYKT